MRAAMVAGAVFLVGAGCGAGDGTEEWSGLARSPLPLFETGLGDCDPPEAPPACDWAVGADVIVWGTLKDVRLVTEPAYVVGGSSVGNVAPYCSGIVEPAIDLELEVEVLLKGNARSPTVVIRVGAEQRNMWSPTPRLGESGGIEWTTHAPEGDARSGEALVIGQKLGAATQQLPSGRLSLMGHLLFGVDVEPDGARVLRFQPFSPDGCELPPPRELEGRSLAEVRELLDACPSTSPAGESLRQRRLGGWGPSGSDSPSNYLTANCFNP